MRRLLTRTAAPALLCAVALAHLLSAGGMGASAWEAGSFGMFSTVDQQLWRTARVRLTVGDVQVPIDTRNPVLVRLLSPAIDTPSQDHLDSVAAIAARLAWHAPAALAAAPPGRIGPAVVPAPPGASPPPGTVALEVQGATVEVHTVVYTTTDDTARARLLGTGRAVAEP